MKTSCNFLHPLGVDRLSFTCRHLECDRGPTDVLVIVVKETFAGAV